MLKKFFAVCTMSMLFVDTVLATGVAVTNDLNVSVLLDQLESTKSDLFSQLEQHIDVVTDKLESTYDDIASDQDYTNLMCMGVVDLGADVEDVEDGASLLKTKILRTYNTLVSDVQYNRDSFENGLISEQTYELSLQSNQADVNDFDTNFSTFVDDFYENQLEGISGTFTYMDTYLSENESLLVSLNQRRSYIDTIDNRYQSLLDKKAIYVQHFGTVLGLDKIHDNLLEQIYQDVREYFDEQREVYLTQHSNFFNLRSQLEKEERILYDVVEVELRRYMDDMIRYYDADQYEVLDEYMNTIKGLYYNDDDELMCNNIIGYRDEPMIESIIALIDDLHASLEDGFEHFDITENNEPSEDFFGEKLNEEYRRIVDMVVERYEERTNEILDTMITQRKEYRANFKDLLRMKAQEFDTANGNERSSIKRDLVSRAKALATKANGSKLLYDVHFFLYTLGEPVFLGAYTYDGLVSMGDVAYLEYLYDDYFSGEDVSSSLVLATGFVPRTSYTVEEVQAKLVLLREMSDDVSSFDNKLEDAIIKAHELLRNPSVPLQQKVLIKVVRDAMWDVVY